MELKVDSTLMPDLARNFSRRKLVNSTMTLLLVLATGAALIPLFAVFGYVLIHGLPSLTASFFTELPRPVGEVGGGMANALAGTLTLLGLASLVGIPWGIGTGLFLSEYPYSRGNAVIRFSVDMLASIPSIIIGLLVYAMVVVPMGRFSAIAGGIALGLLMIPTVARSTEELLRLVPSHIREAGLALGLPRWKVILAVILKGNLAPISTGIILSIARIAGETAPLLFTAFNNQFWQRGIDQPIASVPVQIFNFAISPFEDWHRQAWAGALVLVLLVFTLNLGTKMLFRLRTYRVNR